MFEKTPGDKRIALAKEKMKEVIDHFVYLIAVHENNAVVVYSDELSSQIPKSLAANAFNLFREAMHQIEIIRLCALWEKANEGDLAKKSIPTVVELVATDAIIDALAEETRQAHANVKVNLVDLLDDPDFKAQAEQAVRERNRKYGDERAAKARAELRAVIKEARDLCTSKQLESLRNLRDKELAHVLTETRREKQGPVEPAKYHDETKLLEASIPIVETLYCWVNGTGFSMKESREIHRGYAEALWKACRFKVEK